jgi:hypothetical protein
MQELFCFESFWNSSRDCIKLLSRKLKKSKNGILACWRLYQIPSKHMHSNLKNNEVAFYSHRYLSLLIIISSYYHNRHHY